MSAKPLSYEDSIKHQVLRKSTLYIPSFGNVNELSLELPRYFLLLKSTNDLL